MTAEERHLLALAPFTIITRRCRTYQWAGMLIREESIEDRLRRAGRLQIDAVTNNDYTHLVDECAEVGVDLVSGFAVEDIEVICE